MARSKIISWGLLILSLCFLTVACGNLTQENYEKIKVGMSYQEVEKILGSNPTCDSAMGMKTCTWGLPKSTSASSLSPTRSHCTPQRGSSDPFCAAGFQFRQTL